jgi:hypothetical protein
MNVTDRLYLNIIIIKRCGGAHVLVWRLISLRVLCSWPAWISVANNDEIYFNNAFVCSSPAP